MVIDSSILIEDCWHSTFANVTRLFLQAGAWGQCYCVCTCTVGFSASLLVVQYHHNWINYKFISHKPCWSTYGSQQNVTVYHFSVQRWLKSTVVPMASSCSARSHFHSSPWRYKGLVKCISLYSCMACSLVWVLLLNILLLSTPDPCHMEVIEGNCVLYMCGSPV